MHFPGQDVRLVTAQMPSTDSTSTPVRNINPRESAKMLTVESRIERSKLSA